MKVKYVSIIAIVLVLISGLPLLVGGAMNFASARYANTQTQANANECETGTNCAMNSPQTQGDGIASTPMSLQISKTDGLFNGISNTPFSEERFTIVGLVCGISPPGGAWITCRDGNAGGIHIQELICRTGGDHPVPGPFICLITIMSYDVGPRENTTCDTRLTPGDSQTAICLSKWGPIPPPP
jgi:hypothetical protein